MMQYGTTFWSQKEEADSKDGRRGFPLGLRRASRLPREAGDKAAAVVREDALRLNRFPMKCRTERTGQEISSATKLA